MPCANTFMIILVHSPRLALCHIPSPLPVGSQAFAGNQNILGLFLHRDRKPYLVSVRNPSEGAEKKAQQSTT